MTGNARSCIPDGLLEALAADPTAASSPERLAVARQHAQARVFEEPHVVEAIAERLLLESS